MCFTGSTKPTGLNFNLSGAVKTAGDAVPLPGVQNEFALARASYAINATDFTKDEYD